MNTKILNRSRGHTPALSQAPVKSAMLDVEFVPTVEPVDGPLETDAVSARLLREAVREAGLFQRSVLGHLDHKEWRDRVRSDGQRLVDLLAKIGFKASDEALELRKQV